MGSFYSTCSITHMTLSRQKTSIQLLVPNFYKDFSDSLSMITSNDGCQCFFAPFGFPIHGEYYDYGQIENIKRDKNVEMIEDYFNLTIETLMECIGDDRWFKYGEEKNDEHWKVSTKKKGAIKNIEVLKTMAMTYIRTEVLEYLQQGWEHLDKPKDTGYSSSSRLNKLFEILATPRAETKSAMAKLLARVKKTGKKLTDAEFDEFCGYQNLVNDYNIKQNTYIPSLVETNMFIELPITLDFKTDIFKQQQFLSTFGYALTRVLLPSCYGSQQTNWVETHKFNKFVNELIFADVKEDVEDSRKDYDNEEDFLADTEDYLGEEVALVKDSLTPFVPKIVKKAPVRKAPVKKSEK